MELDEKPTATTPVAFPGAAVITVNFNLKHDTAGCVESLQAAGALLSQIVVVDNASQDDSVAFLRDRFGAELVVLQNQENLGYAHGLNAGIRHVLERTGFDWLLLINNDTFVDGDFLRALEREARKMEHLLIGPVIYYAGAPEQVWAVGDRFVPGTMIGYSLYKNRRLPSPTPALLPVDSLNGCAMLMHRSVFERVGLFDISYFMYGEEVDFCWRARARGFQMVCSTAAKMWHKVSASSRGARSRSVFLRVRNQIRFYRKYQNWTSALVMFPFSTLRSLIVALQFLLKGQPALSAAVFQGWRDGWFA